jgi:hypothetical protein
MEQAIVNQATTSHSSALSRSERAPWRLALLAGLPHLLYPAAAYGYQILHWQPYRTGNGYQIEPSALAFWGLVLCGLVFAWRAGWPRWSATWVGYGLVLLTELLVVLPTTGVSPIESLAIFLGISWFLITIYLLAWTARRDWLAGFLAVLPLMPMWSTYLALDGVIGNEAPIFYVDGALMALIVTWIVRQGNPFRGLGWILAALLLVGLPVAYATVYYSNSQPPVGPAPTPYPGAVVSTFIQYLLGYAIVSVPVWVTAVIQRRRRERI